MMKKRTIITLLVSHLIAVGLGFAAGIYFLPILIAPPPPDQTMVEQAAERADFVGTFSRDRLDSDALHWGEGVISIGSDVISFMGSIAPGPDYRLYLSPEFVETEKDFVRLKPTMLQVGDVKTFDNFVVPLTSDIDASKYRAVIIWCESFGQFITSATYERKTE